MAADRFGFAEAELHGELVEGGLPADDRLHQRQDEPRGEKALGFAHDKTGFPGQRIELVQKALEGL